MKYNFFIFIVLLCVNLRLEAQYSNLNFFSLHQQQGLSGNSVTSIIKDKDGYLWFGTLNGLNMYDGYTFKKFYSGNDSTSLQENKIKSLFLSSKGDLWIAFENEGVSRYNSISESFEHFNFVNENRSLASNIVKGITEDTDSVIYVATSEGIYFKEPSMADFHPLPLLPGKNDKNKHHVNSLLSPLTASITADPHGGVWIAYENWWISHYNHKDKSYTHYNLQAFAGDINRTLITSLNHIRGHLWIGSIGSGLIRFDPVSGRYKQYLTDLGLSSIEDLTMSSDTMLWISSNNGLVSFDPVSKNFSRFEDVYEDSRSLSTSAVLCSYEDDNGIIWVGTATSGINYAFLKKQFRHMPVGLDDFYTLDHRDVSAILHDSEGNMWVGFIGGYIELHDPVDKKKYKIGISSLFNSGIPGTIFDIFEDSEGNIYCGSWKGGLQKYDPIARHFKPFTGSSEGYFNIFDGTDIRDIEEDKKGNLWLAMHGKGVYVFNPKTNALKKFSHQQDNDTTITNDWTFDICIDGNEYVWVTAAHGLSRISQSDFHIKRYYSSDDDPSSLASNRPNFVICDRKGNLWVGTVFYLNLYDRETDKFERFNPGRGIKRTQFKSLEEDSSGNYWSGTTNGIMNFKLIREPYKTPGILEIGHYNIDDGLQSDFFNLRSSSINSKGIIFFGGDKGIDYFNPDEINPSDPKPLIRIKNIEIFGEEVFPGTPKGPEISADDKILLNYDQNMIGIEYVALNYFNNDNNSYSYILEPLNSDWIEAEKNREILFSNLEPGQYSLSLKVTTDREEVQISDRILNFHIQPPFWETLWFRIFLVLLIFTLIILSIMFYTKNLRKKHILLESLVEKRTKQLSHKNLELHEQSNELRSANSLLRKRQDQIQKQTTELKEQSEQLSKNNEELNMLNSMKDKFLSIIAHDLKNPFNTLLGFSELLKEEFDTLSDNRKKEMISYIHESSMGSRNLLDNLLDWSRSQTKRIKVRSESLNMNELSENIHELFIPMLEKKDIILEKEILDELRVWADRDLLNTIFRNLISNAIKFTPTGGKIAIKTCEASADVVCIEIKDSGVGMDADEVKNIFKMDSAKQSRGTAGEKGTGLGLNLVKEFTELMNGSIKIESEKNSGTSVFVYLPANQNSAVEDLSSTKDSFQ